MASTAHNPTADWTAATAAISAPVSSSNDEALVRRARAGDQMAFREIVERYQARVMSFIYRLLRDRNDAEDVAQEVFASAFQSIDRLKVQSTLGSWLYRITVNHCFDYLRKKRVRPLVYESDLSEDALHAIQNSNSTQTPERGFDAALAQRDLVFRLLDSLSLADRSMLLLKEVEGYSLGELAQMHGMNENAIKVRLFRVRRKLLATAAPRGRSYKT